MQLLVKEIMQTTLQKPGILVSPAAFALFQLASEDYLQELMQSWYAALSVKH
jgi:hypothetical protein